MDFYKILRNTLLLLIIVQLLPGIFQTVQEQFGSITGKPKINVGKLHISGTISSADTYISQLQQLFKNNTLDAIVLSVDSGGGSAGSSQALFHDIMTLKQQYNKPVVTWVENTCASGAYYVAAASDYIIASPSAFIGSVGVYIPHVQLKQFIEQFKVQYDIIKSGQFKGINDPLLEQTPEEQELLQGITNDVYHVFTKDIASVRENLKLDNVSEWANGKLFTGHQALEMKMIDDTGSPMTVEEYIKKATGKEGEVQYTTPPRQFNIYEFLGQTSASIMHHLGYASTRISM